MPRTQYGQYETLTITRGPTETASFHFSRNSTTATVPGSRIITIPAGSTYTTGLHWHEEYTENVKVLQGEVKITLAGVTRVYGQKDGVVSFPKLAIHGFGRGDEGDSADDAEDTILEEWVDPEDGFKVVFFYNVFGTLLDANMKPGIGDTIQLFRSLAYVDEYPDLVPGPFPLKWAATHAVLAAASLVGWALGYEPWLKDYTPKYLWEVAETRGASNREKKDK